jgi:hypothetical protein
VNSQQPGSQAQGDDRLRDGDEQVERNFAEQIFSAAHGVGEHFVEDAIVAVHKEGPRTVRGYPKAGHAQHAGEKK